jgi:hypothetical protein
VDTSDRCSNSLQEIVLLPPSLGTIELCRYTVIALAYVDTIYAHNEGLERIHETHKGHHKAPRDHDSWYWINVSDE